jgi:hypothetical protein
MDMKNHALVSAMVFLFYAPILHDVRFSRSYS